jgi:hypothetical protein
VLWGEDEVELSLRFENNKTAHDDLVLDFAGQSWVCDSYYLALDRGLLSEREDADKVRAVLRRLLDQWLRVLQSVPDGGIAYLPYDFSDQYTGWLRCQRSGGLADICRGWAPVEGWSFFPSAVGEYLAALPSFRPDGPTVRVPIEELVQAVQESVAKVS